MDRLEELQQRLRLEFRNEHPEADGMDYDEMMVLWRQFLSTKDEPEWLIEERRRNSIL